MLPKQNKIASQDGAAGSRNGCARGGRRDCPHARGRLGLRFGAAACMLEGSWDLVCTVNLAYNRT